MEAHRLTLTNVRRWLRVVLLLAAPSGCQTLSPCGCDDGPPKPVEACQLVATWSNKVHFVPDIVHNGTPMPGIVGRIYLMDRKDLLQTGDGQFIAELYDDSGPTPGGTMIEKWQIDKDTAKKLLTKDYVGWGYTVLLPLGSYRPDLQKVHLVMRYEPEKGTPLFAAGGPLTLEHPAPPVVQQAAAKVPAAKGN